MHLLPSGQVFYSGPWSPTLAFSPTTQSWSFVAWTIYGDTGERTYGSSVLLPLTPANNYDPKVIIMGGDNPATDTTEIIDLGVSSPTWQQGPRMAQKRVEMEATLLPNGKVLVSAGSAIDEEVSTASLKAELFDPASNSFSPAGSNAFPRLYHNVQLLLPDGTVWLAGVNPAQGTYEKHMEIYMPSYLFNADGNPASGPQIKSVSTVVTYGKTFSVQTPDAATISSVVFMKLGSVTHSFDMDQRYVGLSFTKGDGSLTADVPQNSNLLPPGYYMLFLVNSAGVPSVANFVQIVGAATPLAAIEYKPLVTQPPYPVRRPRSVTEAPLKPRGMHH